MVRSLNNTSRRNFKEIGDFHPTVRAANACCNLQYSTEVSEMDDSLVASIPNNVPCEVWAKISRLPKPWEDSREESRSTDPKYMTSNFALEFIPVVIYHMTDIALRCGPNHFWGRSNVEIRVLLNTAPLEISCGTMECYAQQTLSSMSHALYLRPWQIPA